MLHFCIVLIKNRSIWLIRAYIIKYAKYKAVLSRPKNKKGSSSGLWPI